MKQQLPDLVLLDLGLGGSTTIGVEICRRIRKQYEGVHILIFTGEILNERLWVDVLDAGADGIILKTGELLTQGDVRAVMEGKRMVFNQPILEKILQRFRRSVLGESMRQQARVDYDIDEYDERFLRHLALGYTKDMIAQLKGMPFGVKSLEKRQNDLVARLFGGNERTGINATRLVTRALELRILDLLCRRQIFKCLKVEFHLLATDIKNKSDHNSNLHLCDTLRSSFCCSPCWSPFSRGSAVCTTGASTACSRLRACAG